MTRRRPNRDDDIRHLRLMVRYCEQTAVIVGNHLRSDLDGNWEFQLAACKAIELIGHEAGRLSTEAMKLAPGVEWGRIVAMRNTLAHAYESTNFDLVWETLTIDIPMLLPDLQQVLATLRVAEDATTDGKNRP